MTIWSDIVSILGAKGLIALFFSHVLAILAGWWRRGVAEAKKLEAAAKADIAKATPEAEKILSEAKAEAERIKADGIKVYNDAKAEAEKLLKKL
jgi:hypothetical protein